MVTRRDALKRLALLAGVGGCGTVPAALLGGRSRYRLGACDWSLGKRSDPQSFALASSLGLEGVQLDLGENPSAFLDPQRRRHFQDAAAARGVEIASLALGVLNRVPYKSDPRTEQWVSDSVEVARAMELDVVLLAFFEQNDLKGDPAGQREVIERLKRVAPKAEAAGVVLGLETWLSAPEHRAIIDAVGSPSVRVYYDVANSEKMGYDIYSEIRDLGRDLIREVHAKENGALLGRGRIDFPRVRAALDDIGYRGWVQIEGAVPDGMDRMEAYRWNSAYLREIFHG